MDKADDCGCTPLIYAAKKCHIEVLKALLAAGADKESVNQAGNTGLSLATEKGYIKIVELLESMY